MSEVQSSHTCCMSLGYTSHVGPCWQCDHCAACQSFPNHMTTTSTFRDVLACAMSGDMNPVPGYYQDADDALATDEMQAIRTALDDADLASHLLYGSPRGQWLRKRGLHESVIDWVIGES